MEGTAVSVASLIGNVGEIFSAALGWVADVASTITGNPLLLIFCILPICGIGIGMFRRLLNVQ